MCKKLTYEQVKNEIESKGCKLLSTEYINKDTKLLIQCSCGKEFKKSLHNFRQGQCQCKECGIKKRSKERSLSYEEVRDYINGRNGNGCTLISTEYINNTTPLTIKCSCGKIFHKSFTKFKDRGQKQCSECGYNKISGENNVAYVERFIIQCSHCGKYLPPMTKARINVTPTHFCCPECQNSYWSKHYSGENNPNWNSDLTDKERTQNRKYPEYNQWRKEVYEHDNHTCKCCGIEGNGSNLNAHHIYSYDIHEDLRTNVYNGITLCEDCHKEFHSIYGKGHNTWQQFREYIFNKYLQTNDLHFLALIETIDLRFIQLNNKAS